MSKNSLKNKQPNLKVALNKKPAVVKSRNTYNKEKVDKEKNFSSVKFYSIVAIMVLSILGYLIVSNNGFSLFGFDYKLNIVNHNKSISIFILSVGLVLSGLILFTDKYILSKIKEFLAYLRDATNELNKVVWPDRKTAISMTIMVVIFIGLLALFIWGFDSIISWLFYDVILKR